MKLGTLVHYVHASDFLIVAHGLSYDLSKSKKRGQNHH